MSDVRKSRDMAYSRASGEDDARVFAETGSPDEVSICSKRIEDNTENVEHLFIQTINNTLNQTLSEQSEEHCDIIKLLGQLLGIQDYKVNLFSSWTLKTLAQQVLLFADKIDECDYKNFTNWLFEELVMVYHNPDMSRKEFFELMGGVFHQALSQILDGASLLPLSKFVPLRPLDEENIESHSLIFTEIDSNESLMSKRSQERKATVRESQTKTLRESKISYYENFLYAIIESTYQIFGREVDYTLIQYTCRNQKNVLYYKVPYHFRKPRIVKKLETLKKMSITSDRKSEKTPKRRKSSKKDSIKETSETVRLGINNFILPLSEAVESFNVIQSHKNEEIQTIPEELE